MVQNTFYVFNCWTLIEDCKGNLVALSAAPPASNTFILLYNTGNTTNLKLHIEHLHSPPSASRRSTLIHLLYRFHSIFYSSVLTLTRHRCVPVDTWYRIPQTFPLQWMWQNFLPTLKLIFTQVRVLFDPLNHRTQRTTCITADHMMLFLKYNKVLLVNPWQVRVVGLQLRHQEVCLNIALLGVTGTF